MSRNAATGRGAARLGSVLALGLLLAGAPVAPAPAVALLGQAVSVPSSADYVADFDTLWSVILRDYAYWDAASSADWSRVKSTFRPRAQAARSAADFHQVLEGALDGLRDPQARLVGGGTAAKRRANADIWAEMREGRAVVTEVREGSPAEKAGVEAGMEVLTVEGIPIEEALAESARLAATLPADATLDWELRDLLAGEPGGRRTLELRDQRRKTRIVRIEDPVEEIDPRLIPAPLAWTTLPDGLGRVTITDMDSLDIVAQFDRALQELRTTPGLLLDIRWLPRGGSPDVVRGILSRLVGTELPYLRRSMPASKVWPDLERQWIELVRPRGAFTYSAPVVAIVSHWTADAAEDLALGLDGTRRATVVGTPMAGRRGEPVPLRLPRTGVLVQFPRTRSHHLDGTPRERWVPPVAVDVSAEGARRADDPVLQAGLAELRKLAGIGS